MDRLPHKGCNSIVNALELHMFFIKQSKYFYAQKYIQERTGMVLTHWGGVMHLCVTKLGPALVQTIACHLFGPKLSSEQMPAYCIIHWTLEDIFF